MDLNQANGFFSILDFGAVGDGKTDCTAAIQAAVDAAAKGGGTVWIPAGHFLTGEIRLVPGVNMLGMKEAIVDRGGQDETLILEGNAVSLATGEPD